MQVCERCSIPIVLGSRDVRMCAGSIGPGQMTTGIDTPLPGIQQQQMKWCCNCAYNAQLTYSNTDFHNSYKRYGCGSCHQSMYSSKNIFSSKCKWCDQPKNKHIHVDSTKAGLYAGWYRCDPTVPKNQAALPGVDVPTVMANFNTDPVGAAY